MESYRKRTTFAMIQTMVNYLRSLHQPEAHKQDIGDSILPQVRLMAHPLVMVIPMLYASTVLEACIDGFRLQDTGIWGHIVGKPDVTSDH